MLPGSVRNKILHDQSCVQLRSLDFFLFTLLLTPFACTTSHRLNDKQSKGDLGTASFCLVIENELTGFWMGYFIAPRTICTCYVHFVFLLWAKTTVIKVSLSFGIYMCFNGFSFSWVQTSISPNSVMELLQKWLVTLAGSVRKSVCVCKVHWKSMVEKQWPPLGSNWSLQSIFNTLPTRLPSGLRDCALPSWRKESQAFSIVSLRSQTGSQLAESAHRHVLFGPCSAFKNFMPTF